MIDEEFGLRRLLSQSGCIRTLPMPGILCQTCAAKGTEVWVLPGRACGYCRTPAPDEDSAEADDRCDHDHTHLRAL
ncbi:hypothetical protein QBC35DRAFT_394395 [Podospora australis]|uniref:Uncharacterized protein n=1 Tax=Podospora australis TaxID=1536484 RepID=A0AAN7AC51_9PEZI|nr:hypothetical protein QBC35DRAFT_394395 [Podospora australis]